MAKISFCLFVFCLQGEKNNGYEVLYQNMKYGLSATKELAEYFRERSNLEEYNSKLLTKLANKAGSGGGGTFSPLWIILKSTTERLSELHAAKVQKLSELVKNINKYAEELHKKHKTVKEEESGTQDAVQVGSLNCFGFLHNSAIDLFFFTVRIGYEGFHSGGGESEGRLQQSVAGAGEGPQGQLDQGD